MEGDYQNEEVVVVPIDGTLDLHNYRPKEVKDLVPDYLEECQAQGIYQVRIVHGKGTGTLRRTVHSILSKLSIVSSFRIAGEEGGGWGATYVELHKAMK